MQCSIESLPQSESGLAFWQGDAENPAAVLQALILKVRIGIASLAC